LVLNSDVAENGARTGAADAPAEGALVGDEVVRGVDVEFVPARNESGDDGEVFDLRRGHGVAVAVEDGAAGGGRANARKVEALVAHGANGGDEGVVRFGGEEQEGGAGIDDGVSVVLGEVAQAPAVH